MDVVNYLRSKGVIMGQSQRQNTVSVSAGNDIVMTVYKPDEVKAILDKISAEDIFVVAWFLKLPYSVLGWGFMGSYKETFTIVLKNPMIDKNRLKKFVIFIDGNPEIPNTPK